MTSFQRYAKYTRHFDVIVLFVIVIFVRIFNSLAEETQTKMNTTVNANEYDDSMDNNTEVLFRQSFENSSSFGDESSDIFPKSWQNFCSASDKTWTKNFTGEYIEIVCEVIGSDFMDFLSLRNFTSDIPDNILFSVVIMCRDGGTLFFPYPGRARLLHSLYISSCIISGFRSEARDKSIDLIADDVRYLTMLNCIILTTSADLFDSLEPEQLSKAFECGPLNAIEITERNLRNAFVNVTSFNLSEDAVMQKNKDFHRQHFFTSHRCKYEHLLSLDRSFYSGVGRQSLMNQLRNYFYPLAEFFNYSSSGIRTIPTQFNDWRLLSKNLKYVDLSYNKITELDLFTCHGDLHERTVGTLDLRYNNISSLKKRDVNNLFTKTCKNLLVDIRGNPFNCDCEMKDFIYSLNNNYKGGSRYKYLFNLTCFHPLSLRGRIIYQLSHKEIGCEILLTTFMKAPVIVLCCFVLIFIVCVILGIRYKKEIIILTYTRLHILLPCQRIKTDYNKRYDAFIAYSQQDVHWVIFTLAKRLENPESDQHFSLCLHHRDFIVGAAISDNIVQSVESSRHTIIVVSKSFLKSEWCRLEFRTALHQSLLEKKRHLIIILLEDIPPSDFEPELKRCMQTLTYVKVDDRWFWDKLIYALTDWSKQTKKKSSNISKCSS